MKEFKQKKIFSVLCHVVGIFLIKLVFALQRAKK